MEMNPVENFGSIYAPTQQNPSYLDRLSQPNKNITP